MFTVQYTEAKIVKGEFKNIYKSESFETAQEAEQFAAEQKGRSDVTGVRTFCH